jgi:AraC-like DNA-binding protein
MPLHRYFRYLPVSKRDRLWDLYVTGAGHADEPPGTTYPRTVHPEPYCYDWQRGRVLPEYAMLYITRGQGEFESEATGRRDVVAGSAVLLLPGVWHRYRPGGKAGWSKYSVAFGGGYPDLLVRREFLPRQTAVFETGLDDALLHGYLRLLSRVRTEPPGYPQLIAADTMEILAAALAATRLQQMGTALEAVVRRARHSLEQHAEDLVDMKQLAASLGLSYERFRHVFKQQTGMAPGQYHLQVRLNRAKDLLRSTNHSIKEIAAALNFDDLYHFSKVFKKHVGLPPSQWRGNMDSDASL